MGTRTLGGGKHANARHMALWGLPTVGTYNTSIGAGMLPPWLDPAVRSPLLCVAVRTLTQPLAVRETPRNGSTGASQSVPFKFNSHQSC